MIALWGIALGDLLGWLILLLALVSWGWLSFIRSAARGALVFKWGCSAVLLFIIVLLISKHQTYLTPFPRASRRLAWCDVGAQPRQTHHQTAH